jgi:hypothetical protein
MACGAISESFAPSNLFRLSRVGGCWQFWRRSSDFKGLAAENCHKIKFVRCRFAPDSMLPIGSRHGIATRLKDANESERVCVTGQIQRIEQNTNIVKTMFNARALTGRAASCRLQFRPDIIIATARVASAVPIEPMALPQA